MFNLCFAGSTVANMYLYLWIKIRKLYRSAWNRYISSKRERASSFSSLQECLDHQPVIRSGLWRKWFLLLLVASSIYYVTFFQKIWNNELSVSKIVRPIPKQTTENTLTAWSSEKPTNDSTRTTPLQSTLQNGKSNKSIIVIESSKFKTEVTGNPGQTNGAHVINKMYGSYYRFVSQMLKKGVKAISWCEFKTDAQMADVNNISTTQWYRGLVNQGGSFSPDYCIPRHKVAIIVPFRDRGPNLAVFLFTIHPFLIDQMLDYRIFVVEQSGKELFNKGRLFNAAFIEAMKLRQWDCLVFHDVDLLPTSRFILYSCPIWPRHMCPTLVENGKSVYNFHSYFGGVSSMTTKHFMNVNGFSNLYWGWGGEDTDMFWRIKGAGLPMTRYQKDIAKYITLPHDRRPECKNKKKLITTAVGRYPFDGLTTLKYEVVSMTLFHLYTHILVDVNPPSDNATTAGPSNLHVKV